MLTLPERVHCSSGRPALNRRAVRTFRSVYTVSDELSAAALTRGIEAPQHRTSYYELKIGWADAVLFIFLFLLLLAAYFPKLGVFL